MGVGFPIQGSQVQNQWMAPRTTQPFIPQRSVKWIPESPETLVVKHKLSPRSESTALRQVNPMHKKGS